VGNIILFLLWAGGSATTGHGFDGDLVHGVDGGDGAAGLAAVWKVCIIGHESAVLEIFCYQVVSQLRRKAGEKHGYEGGAGSVSGGRQVHHLSHGIRSLYITHTVKKRFASFPSPAGMSLPNSPWAGIMTS
jgi:hypothetical protein